MRFEIRAYRDQEGIVSLAIDAKSVEDAQAQAQEQGLEVFSIRQRWKLQLFAPKSQEFDLLLFSQELLALMDAGLSLIEALGALSRKETSSQKQQLIGEVTRRLREGKSLSTVLRTFPSVFPPLYVALVSASEQTGNLASALSRFIEYRSQMDALRKRVISAAIYPALLIVVGGLVILFLMLYVVPRFSRVYEDFGRGLPIMSRLLMHWGSLVQEYGLQLLALSIVVAILLTMTMKGKFSWSILLRKLFSHSALRTRYQLYSISRFYRALGMLQQGGIPIVSALGLSRELLDESQQVAMDQALNDIRGGIALSETLEKHGLAPTVASDLLKVGERTGDLGEKMIRIANFYDEDISRWVEWFSKLFEPLLMLGIGLFIALIVVLLYMPIFELAGSVQ